MRTEMFQPQPGMGDLKDADHGATPHFPRWGVGLLIQARFGLPMPFGYSRGGAKIRDLVGRENGELARMQA